MSLGAPLLVVASAIFSHSFHILQVRQHERTDSCKIFAQADDGPLIAEVTWASCREVDIRIMSAAELEKAGQLENLGMIRQIFLKQPNQVFLTAWGKNAATLYARARKGKANTVEITLAD